jgi:hypothetical protein
MLCSNKNNWNQMKSDGVKSNDIAKKASKWMEDNKAEASCMFPVGAAATHGGSSTFNVDRGVIAYGWNNKAFNWNGHAGEWVDLCQCTNETPCLV